MCYSHASERERVSVSFSWVMLPSSRCTLRYPDENARSRENYMNKVYNAYYSIWGTGESFANKYYLFLKL